MSPLVVGGGGPSSPFVGAGNGPSSLLVVVVLVGPRRRWWGVVMGRWWVVVVVCPRRRSCCRLVMACCRHCVRGGGRGSGYTYGVCSDLGGVLRAASSRLRSWAAFPRRQVSGFKMVRREHTIDGAMAIDRVCNVLCGGGASLPLTSCCLLSSPSSCLRYTVLDIGRVCIFRV